MVKLGLDQECLLDTSEWEQDTTTIPQDGATRNPRIESGQAPVWFSATQPDARPTTIDEILAPYGQPDVKNQPIATPPGHIDLGCCHVRAFYLNISLAILTTISSVGLVVTLPIYSEFVISAGSDPYMIIVWTALWTSIIFFSVNILSIIVSKICKRGGVKTWKSMLPHAPWGLVVIIGVCSSINGLLAVYASDPRRTPGYLQAVLACTVIPYTVLLRYCILKKSVSTIRLICCFMVLVGLFIASEPEIFDLNNGDNSSTGNIIHKSLSYRIMWPLCFALSIVPVAITSVLVEKGCKREEVQNLAFISWTGLFQGIILLFLFWTDLIPGFGLSKNIHEFSEHLRIGFECHVGLRDSCYPLTYIPWIFVGFYMLTNLSSFLLTRYAEGAIYTSIVSALATPIAALFWSVFRSDPFRYDPKFTVITAYTLAGLFLMLPGTMMYNYFSSKEEKENRNVVLWTDITSEDQIYRESA